jgi:Arc/MetJ family transcription regulator
MKTTRTNIVLNDQLVAEAMKLSRAASKKEMIEKAIENYIRLIKRKQLADLRGKVEWVGDLDKMRKGRL